VLFTAPLQRVKVQLQVVAPASLDAWARASYTVSVTNTVRHPAFDVDRARARAAVPGGPFVYDLPVRRWALLDENRQRTLLVGGHGPVVELPGDWLQMLVSLGSAAEATVFWSVPAGAAQQLLRELTAAQVETRVFSFKGRADPGRLLIVVTRQRLLQLAAIIRRHRARMSRDWIR